MAILNPQLLEDFNKNDTNSTSPSTILLDDGYSFGDIPASANHNFMFAQIYTYLNFLKESGVSRWDSSITYKKQAMVARQEKIYFSIGDGNIANDPTTTSDLADPAPSWISLEDLIIAPFYTNTIVNAGSKSTINALSYFGTVAALKDNAFYGIRIKTGTIDFPGNVEVSIDGLSVKTATLALPDYNTQVALVIGLRYIAGGTDAFQSVITSENIVDTFRSQSIQDTLDAIKSAAFFDADTSEAASTIARRDGSGDIAARLFSSSFAEQTSAPASTADIAFRIDKTTNTHIRFMSLAAMLDWLSVYTKSESDARYLLESNNLSDLVDDATARTNLDVYNKAEVDGDNSLIANGYQKLPGGLIMQWGQFVSTSSSAETVTFPTAFDTACFQVVSNRVQDNAHSPISGTAWNTTGFTINRDDAISGTAFISWFAIGH